QSFGRTLPKLLEVSRRSRLDEIADHGKGSGTEAAYTSDLAGVEHGSEVVSAEREDALCRGLVRARLELVLTTQLEICGDLREYVRGGATIHGQRAEGCG